MDSTYSQPNDVKGLLAYVERKGQMALFSLTIVNFLLFAGATVVCMYEQSESNQLIGEDNSNIFKWIILIFYNVASLYYSYHSLLRENVLELFAFVVISLVTTACGGYRFMYLAVYHKQSDISLGGAIVCYIYTGATVILWFVYLYMSIHIRDKLLWNIFLKIGGSDVMKRLYENQQYFLALVKLYYFIAFAAFLTYFFFNQRFDWFVILLNSISIFTLLVSTFVAYKGVTDEIKSYVYVYMTLISLTQLIQIAEIVLLATKAGITVENLDIQTVLIIGVTEIVCTAIWIASLVYSTKCLRGFQDGLKQHLQQMNEMQESDV